MAYYQDRATEIAAFQILLHVNSQDARNTSIARTDRALIARTAQINRRALGQLGMAA